MKDLRVDKEKNGTNQKGLLLADPQRGPVEKERRRSQRVLLVIPIEVEWTTKEGKSTKEAAETEIVSAHGALLRMKSRIPLSIEITLYQRRVRQSTRARVVGVSSRPDGERVAVELSIPSWSFWGVSFPDVPAIAAS